MVAIRVLLSCGVIGVSCLVSAAIAAACGVDYLIVPLEIVAAMAFAGVPVAALALIWSTP